MKSAFLSGLLLLGSIASLQAQTTVNFKPGPATAQDATLWELDGGCIPYGQKATPAVTNYGFNSFFGYSAWTWMAAGCNTGLVRSVIRFDDLSSIPTNATITSAHLKLYGIPPDPNTWGNNYFPGTPLPNVNTGTLYQLDDAQPLWYQNSVTWNDFLAPKPGAPTTSIPYTTSQWNWDVALDVTAQVQDMVSTPSHNHGFLMKLDNEVHYRGVNFATSDNADPSLWPELEVTYQVCNAGYSYCVNMGFPYTFNFTANDPGGVYYGWTVDGVFAGAGTTLTYNFPGPGTYKVCLTMQPDDTHKCTQCYDICVSENGKPVYARPAKQPASEKAVPQGKMLPMDAIATRIIKVSPNPSHTGWTISLNAEEGGEAKITLYDITGKKVAAYTQKLGKGNNSIYQSATGLADGVYVIEINNNGQIMREKLTRN
ncbi:DNRLRE domain-containing protein [Chitinophagaceae bacterium MMS25-I14]